ncbi:hypothetical protein LJ725_02360 [Reyranella aquatilis]|uniref:DUF6867 domain-containing protein n=1 Tax=Reyranella aquatilis TaxID=2035356 RepID=A0ABS8KP14_9HYPH|nr:hypothetical protein [Reyranella aquatilis]MCC8427790.1 hypothetical protein [Reyranella aquatilis]
MSPLDTFMFDWFGDTLFNVLLFNLVLIGPASFAAGHAVALTWRPWPQIVFYTMLLSATLRFLDYALANGELWSLAGFVLGWAVQLAIAAFAFRLTRARQMVRQYPWLYRRKGLLGWDEGP